MKKLKMKKIYKDFSYGKELVGYEYKGHFIEVENEFHGNKGLYGTIKRWYHVTLENGKHTCFDLLKDAKEYIEREMNK